MIKAQNILVTIYGLTTVIVFTLMIVVSGLFNSIHTVLFRELSFFISPYSLSQNVTVPMYNVYNTLLLLFSLLLLLRLHNVFAKLGALYLSMSAVMSLYLVSFPMDAVYLSQSLNGSTHIVISLLVVMYGFVAMMLFGYGFKYLKHFAFLSRYSFQLSALILITGFMTALFALINMSEYVGFIQKIPIGGFIVWIFLTAVMMIHSDKRVKYIKRRKN